MGKQEVRKKQDIRSYQLKTMEKIEQNVKMCLSFPDSSVGKESTCDAGDPVWLLGQEDPLEKGQATHASILGLPLWLRW